MQEVLERSWALLSIKGLSNIYDRQFKGYQKFVKLGGMKKLVQERFKGYEKFAEDSLRGTKFSQNKIRGMKFFTKKIRGRKKMGSREKNAPGGYPPPE